MFTKELVAEKECLEEHECESELDVVMHIGEDRVQPHISLSTLAGINTFQTTRVKEITIT